MCRIATRLAPQPHPSVRTDPHRAARHSAVMSTHVLAGVLAAGVFAAHVALTGRFGIAVALVCVWFLSPLAIATFLSRTGDLDGAYLLSAANLAGIVGLVAGLSGGTSSFALAWLALVPLEAALSDNRRVVVSAVVVALAVAVALYALTALSMLPRPAGLTAPVDQTLIGHLAAVAYAGGLVASIQASHRQAQAAIADSRERYQLIAENTNDLVTCHTADGRLTFASLASSRLLGIEPAQLVAHGFRHVLSDEDCRRFEAVVTDCVARGQPTAGEFRLADPCPDNRSAPRWIEMRCQPVRGGTADGHAVVAVTRDVSERKHEALALADALDAAERASRAKTAFLATMSHELRTPLNAIIGFAELLHRDLTTKSRDARQADHCRVIHESGEHLLSLVNDLIDVSKIESGHFSITPEPFPIGVMIESCVVSLSTAAQRRRLSIKTCIEAELPDALADRRAVRQMVLNLLSNACKFSNEGGTVTVGVRSVRDRIEITVADNGIGIPPEHLDKLGKPFYQVETSYSRRIEGTGLGLSIVRGLVELHGGTLQIASRQGRGTTCSISVPADHGGQAHSPALAPPASMATLVPV
jgi:cell cycle sensor histidine kinase DivJ